MRLVGAKEGELLPFPSSLLISSQRQRSGMRLNSACFVRCCLGMSRSVKDEAMNDVGRMSRSLEAQRENVGTHGKGGRRASEAGEASTCEANTCWLCVPKYIFINRQPDGRTNGGCALLWASPTPLPSFLPLLSLPCKTNFV